MDTIGILIAIVGILGVILMLIGFLTTTDDPKGINKIAIVGIVLVGVAVVALAVMAALVGLGKIEITQIPSNLPANYASMVPIQQEEPCDPEAQNCSSLEDWILPLLGAVSILTLFSYVDWRIRSSVLPPGG